MSFISGTIGALVNRNASKSAASAQKAAAATASETEERIFDKGLAVIQPAIDSGNRARSAVEFELGLGGRPDFGAQSNALAGGYQGFQATPGYQFRVDEGMKGLQRAAAAGGGLDSGATRKAALRYGQGIAADEYGTYMNRLAALSNTGQTASNNAFAGFQGLGGSLANNALAAGNAQSAGIIGAANATNQGLSSFSRGIGQAAGIFGGF